MQQLMQVSSALQQNCHTVAGRSHSLVQRERRKWTTGREERKTEEEKEEVEEEEEANNRGQEI